MVDGPDSGQVENERLAAMRVIYEREGLNESDLADTWLAQFHIWFDEVAGAGISEPNAMIVATASAEARPSVRTVLLKGLNEKGFVFYTHHTSLKGVEALENPVASIVFPWHALQRQVRISGTVEKVSDAESDAYFASRPYGARIGAAASHQSEVIGSRAELEAEVARLIAKYPDTVPRPATWGGLRVRPEWVEFWQGRPDRLHDRLRYRLSDDRWTVERLAP